MLLVDGSRDDPFVDNYQHLTLPPGTTLADIDGRIAELRRLPEAK